MVTLDERLSRAAALHAAGYNCAQCVLISFADLYSDKVSEQTVAAMSVALGGGVCGTGHICGAASAMACTLALLNYSSPADKRAVYDRGAEVIRRFADMQQGRTDCRQLRVPGLKPCNGLIADAVKVLHTYLAEADAL